MPKLENVGKTVIENDNKKYLVTYKNSHEFDWYEITNQGYQSMLSAPRWYYADAEYYFMSILNKMKKELE
jgi:hypothetical protein